MRRLFETFGLFEQAYNRMDFKKKVESFTTQIVENLALLVYCKLYDKTNQNRNHWRRELVSYLSILTEVVVKNASKKQVLEDVWLNVRELDTKSGILVEVTVKFLKEGLFVEDPKVQRTFSETTKYIRPLIDKIASEDYPTIKQWVNQI